MTIRGNYSGAADTVVSVSSVTSNRSLIRKNSRCRLYVTAWTFLSVQPSFYCSNCGTNYNNSDFTIVVQGMFA